MLDVSLSALGFYDISFMALLFILARSCLAHRDVPMDSPAALLVKERERKASFLATHMWEHLNLDRVEDTGQLIPRGSIKKRESRCMFGFIIDQGNCTGRWLTKKVCVKAVRKLVSWLEFDPPVGPRTTRRDFISQEALVLQEQCRKAKKHLNNKSRTMDHVETQPIDQDLG